MACEQYAECKSRLFPDDPMIEVKYPSGRIATICHDCCNDKGELPKTGTQIPKMGNVIKDLNTRISVLEKMLEANPVMTKTGEIKEVRL